MERDITFEVNNQGIMRLIQETHDGPVDVIVFNAPIDGVRGVRHGDVISPGDMVMLMNYYRHQKEHGAQIFEPEPSIINDVRALLKMIRFDQLPEPARSLAERVKERVKQEV